MVAALLAERSQPGDYILIKGSRGMQLERALTSLEAQLPPDGPPAPRTRED